MKTLRTSAPGTLMLMGEHAVLHGKHALVAATDQRLQVYLTPRQDQHLRLYSSLGEYECNLQTIEVKPPFTFLLSLLKQLQLKQGFDLRIESDFSATVGLGSSAAVLVATARHFIADHTALFEITYRSLRDVQGCGSGADLAAAILGGIIWYRQSPFSWEKLAFLFPITLVYAGYKTPTPEVIQRVEQARQAQPQKFEQIFKAIDQATLLARTALQNQDLDAFAAAFKTNQNLMVKLGVVDQTLQNIIDLFGETPAKVSGSGLGDCVIGLKSQAKIGDYAVLKAQLSLRGVESHDH